MIAHYCKQCRGYASGVCRTTGKRVFANLPECVEVKITGLDLFDPLPTVGNELRALRIKAGVSLYDAQKIAQQVRPDGSDALPHDVINGTKIIQDYELDAAEVPAPVKERLILAYNMLLGDYDAINLISLAEYAKIHGVDPATIKQGCQRGRYKTARKIAGRWLIDENEPHIDGRRKPEKS